jgi:tRNA(fMet)-specific endonuclease VapC
LEEVVSRFQATARGDLAIASVVAYEIEYGTLKSRALRRRTIIEELLKGIEQVPFDRDAALESARIRIDLEARGFSIGPMDLLIAGTALSRAATLATNNTKEFARVKGLRLVDWTQRSSGRK